MQDPQHGGTFAPRMAVAYEEHRINIVRIDACLREQLPPGCALHRCKAQHALSIVFQQELREAAAQQAVRVIDDDHAGSVVVRSR